MKIAFCHNTSGNTNLRYTFFEETVRREREAFPDCEHYTFCDGIPHKFDHPTLFSNKQLGHKIGSLHGFIRSVQLAMMNTDANIFVFSHDDVYLEDVDMFKEHLDNVSSEGWDVTARVFPDFRNPTLEDVEYVSFETIILSKFAVEHILSVAGIDDITDEKHLIQDHRDSYSPELQVGDMIKGLDMKHLIPLDGNDYGLNALGYHHRELPRGYGWE